MIYDSQLPWKDFDNDNYPQACPPECHQEYHNRAYHREYETRFLLQVLQYHFQPRQDYQVFQVQHHDPLK